MKEEWLLPGAIVPVDVDTTAALVAEIKRLIGVVGEMALDKQRQWLGLTDEEIDQGLLRSDYALQTAHAWRAGVVFAMTKLKEKNG